jgi:anti-sigma factor RsiW
VNHRHLLPNEIDLLVDGELGFGVAPLKAHVESCPQCRAELEEARRVADALESLPHHAPSFGFTDKVMSQVPVFVPWHVAARESLARLAPASRPLRVLAMGGGALTATLITLMLGWLWTRGDLLMITTGLFGERVREALVTGARDLAAVVLGEQFLVALQQSGAVGVALAMAGFLGAAVLTLAGLKALTLGSRRP